MANDILVKETEQKLIGQIAPILEGASGGQIKVIKNPQEGALFQAQAEAETARRLEASPELRELAELERQRLEDEEKAAAAEKTAEVDAAPQTADAAPQTAATAVAAE